MEEKSIVAAAKVFANAVWPKYSEFLKQAATMSPADLRRHPVTDRLHDDTQDYMKGLPVVRVKLYDLNGNTVFSTDRHQIGADKSANAGFRHARDGVLTSQRYLRDEHSASENEVSHQDLLSVYVPVRNQAGEVEAVAELYYDIVPLMAQIGRSSQDLVLTVGAVLLSVYLLLIAIVYRRDRVIARQHRQNVKLAAAAAAASEESRMKSAFLANMSHELRTPLNAILGFSDAMRKEMFGALGSDRYVAYAEDIWRSGCRLQDIVDDVLDLAKIENGTAELAEDEFALSDLLSSCVNVARRTGDRKELQVSVDLPAAAVFLTGDRARLSQAVINVLSNAVKFSPAGGEIGIRATADERSGLAIHISDRGEGMDPETVRSALTAFGGVSDIYVRAQGGAGLGLPLAASAMQLHDGMLRIESAAGRGTTVTLLLPPARLRIERPAAEQHTERKAAAGLAAA